MERDSKMVSDLFDNLAIEAFFGFNFRMCLLDDKILDDRDVIYLIKIIEKVKKERNGTT